MAFHPYLYFGGNCRAAFTRYQQIFGGELVLLPFSDVPADQPIPPEQGNLIMHAALKFEDHLLMASDDPSGGFEPPRGIYVNYTIDNVDQADQVFADLIEGGTVTMPMEETFWAPRFGMCIDRFGTPWMINAEAPEPS